MYCGSSVIVVTEKKNFATMLKTMLPSLRRAVITDGTWLQHVTKTFHSFINSKPRWTDRTLAKQLLLLLGADDQGRNQAWAWGGLSPLNDAAAPPQRRWNSVKKLYLFIHNSAVQLVSKRVLSGSDCLKINGGCGFAPDPTGGAYSAPPDLLAAFKGSYF